MRRQLESECESIRRLLKSAAEENAGLDREALESRSKGEFWANKCRNSRQQAENQAGFNAGVREELPFLEKQVRLARTGLEQLE